MSDPGSVDPVELQLRKRWDLAWRNLSTDSTSDETAAVLDDLLARHAEPRRHYHTAEHVLAVLAALDVLESAPSAAAQLAAWFHDAVYDPTATGGANEEASAALAEATLARLGVDRTIIANAAVFIRATAGHRLDATVPGCAIFLDADLAILGASPVDYSRYAANIRLEYSHVPSDLYREGRSRILEDFGQRTRLFYSDAGHARFDAQARVNLRHELRELNP